MVTANGKALYRYPFNGYVEAVKKPTKTGRKPTKRAERGTDALTLLEKTFGPLTFGRMMESFRLCDELSQAAMARKLKIPRQHLCDIEKGQRQVSAERAAQFARLLEHNEQQFVELALNDQLTHAGLKMKVRIKAV